jgi:hypothetical protein
MVKNSNLMKGKRRAPPGVAAQKPDRLEHSESALRRHCG